MKIALTIFRYFPYGGLQLDFGRIAAELVRRGHDVTAYTGKWEGAQIPGPQVRIVPVHGLSNHGRAGAFERNALRMIAADSPDVICGFNKMDGLDVYFAGDNCFRRKNGRGAGVFKRIISGRCRVYEAMERSVFQGSAMIMALTERQIEEFRRIYGTPAERFIVLPPGIPEKCRRPEDEAEILRRRRAVFAEFSFPEEAVLLLQICSDFHTKGVDRTIRAVAALPEEIRHNVRLLVAGREKEPSCRRLAGNLGVAEQVVFAGSRDDVEILISAAGLMVHPARKEAAGNVIAEAVAGGLPVIASGCCGYSPMVSQCGGVVLNEPFEQNELNCELAEVLADRETLEYMSGLVCNYSAGEDFYRRAEVAADFIERIGNKNE